MQTLNQLQNGELKGAVSLKLAGGLYQFPPEIFELADTLEVLDLSGNNLSLLPPDFGRLRKLRIFFCSDNLFTVLPEVLADCPLLDIVGFKANKIARVPGRSLNPNLRWLILTNNRIAGLPAQIGNCPRMQKLMLAGNKLEELPIELSRCRNLALLRISANCLTSLPPWLLAMPKLSWLACSGNRFAKTPDVKPLPAVLWGSLEISHVLGEGASGVIYKADSNLNGKAKTVAVKVFKGEVTSDGLPADEMHTYIAAGSHPGLVPLIGRVTGHPEGKQGLVMELIPDRFFNLGITPSFESCTRDVFKTGMSLPPKQIITIAATLASLAAQLHHRGIMHGDTYAHNILTDQEGNALFGDFGAACFYNKDDKATAPALERIEVSAYGYLLDDLLALCKQPGTCPSLTKLAQLRDHCLAPDVLSRPGFQYLKDELAALAAEVTPHE